ncbi:MAG: prepilin peptidase, partial [Roseimicrobium sp.]
MTRAVIVNYLIHTLIFLLGSGIGSFLNVVIYRLPLGLSVNKPRRSFCPACKKQIPWYRNLPLFTWLVQRGKCAECGAPIAFRYFFVELLTGVLFYAIFIQFGGPWEALAHWGPLVLVYWIFAALLVAGTFIDLDHFILPDEITKSGLVVGLLASYAVPELMDVRDRQTAILLSFVSACLGYGVVKSIVEFGKLAFGRLRHRFDPPASWSVAQPDVNEPPVLTVNEEVLSWYDIFSRPTDRLIIAGESLTVNERVFGAARAEVKSESLRVTPAEGEALDIKLEEVNVLHGRA